VKRLATFAVVVLAGFAWAGVAVAGSEDGGDHHYTVELDSAFGLVKGSEVLIAGVKAGTVQSLEISPEKRALVHIETSGALGVLGAGSTCSAQPQSLISEYFLDCEPKGAPLAEDGTIPVEQSTQTVQLDLVLNTLREPYRARLALLLNEFGTALAGNGDNLNAAIRRGAPALRNLRRAFGILAEDRGQIRSLIGDANQIFARLAERRKDVSRFVDTAATTASAAANRHEELGQDVALLDDFLRELKPTATELTSFAAQGEPLLANLRAAAPRLTTLADLFPGFADSANQAVTGLGDASVVGTRALSKGRDELSTLAQGSTKVAGTAKPLDDLLADVRDPRRIVETDARAAKACNDPTKSCWSTGRDAPTGYTGIEGVLNYAYYLAGGTNQYDALGHLLHFSVYAGGPSDPCGGANTGGRPGTPTFGVPKLGGGYTTNLLDAAHCVSWLGPNQPRINQEVKLPPYDPSVCPEGSNAPDLCDPNGFAAKRKGVLGSLAATPAATPTTSTTKGPEPGGSAGAAEQPPVDQGGGAAVTNLLDFLFGQ
jgi:virulence factor Mce-like protein